MSLRPNDIIWEVTTGCGESIIRIPQNTVTAITSHGSIQVDGITRQDSIININKSEFQIQYKSDESNDEVWIEWECKYVTEKGIILLKLRFTQNLIVYF